MARGWVHTVPKDGRWTNVIEGDDSDTANPSYLYRYQAEDEGLRAAIAAATDHVIHNSDGTISAQASFRDTSPSDDDSWAYRTAPEGASYDDLPRTACG